MKEKIVPMNYSECLCFKCLKEKEKIKKYFVGYRGYGSSFDNFNSIIQLCEECDHKDLQMWVDEKPTMIDDYCEDYKYEDDIWDFVNTLPIQGRELFDNQCSDGACSCHMESQDWIDIELEIAPDSLYKQYGMYSPSEIQAYKDRFPTCENVYVKTYKDGSSHCKCDYGAFGDSDGTCGLNICDECYTCRRYKKKGFDFVYREEKQLYIEPSKLKKIEMYEWTCEVCGEIIHTHTYSDTFSCPKCFQWYDVEDDIEDELEYVYCTECAHFRLKDEDVPYCEYDDICDISNCVDSKSIENRPYYKKI